MVVLSYLVFDAATLAGIVIACYRSFKAAKSSSRRDGEVMLMFWVLFAMLCFVGTYVEFYVRELKFVLTVGALFSGRGAVAVPAVYSRTVEPLFKKYGRPVTKRLGWIRRRAVSVLSRVHRGMSNPALRASLPGAELAGLAATEAALQDTVELISREARRRRTSQLKRSRRRLSRVPKIDEMRPADASADEHDIRDGKLALPEGSSSDDDVDLAGVRSSDDDGAGAGSSDDDAFSNDSWVQVPSNVGGNAFTPAPTLRRRRPPGRYSTGAM